MALTQAEALALVDTLEGELRLRQEWTERADSYYRGIHPLRFASEEFAGYFADRYEDFSDNWVPVVADAPVERLTVTGFQLGGKPDDEAWRVWQVNNLDCDSQLGFLSAVLSGRSYVLVWPDPADDTAPCVTFEDAGQAIVLYEPGSRFRRRAALKEWQDGQTMHAVLYTAADAWHFERPVTRREKTPQMALADDLADKWLPSEAGAIPAYQPNPMGLVPLVELANRPMLFGGPLSDVAPVIPLQDAVNLLWAHLMTAADFAAIPQRYVLGADVPADPLYDDDGNKIGSTPQDLTPYKLARMLWVPDENATAGSWPAAQLSAYANVIENVIGHLAAQTRTPQHYLIGKMSNVGSDTLLAAEAGLVKRVNEKQLWFGAALREVMRLAALAQGDNGRAGAYRSGRVLWADTESRSQAQLVASLVQLKSIGFPFKDLAMRLGLTEEEAGQLVKMREDEAASDPVLAALGTGSGGAQPAEVGNDGQAAEQDVLGGDSAAA